MKSKQKRSALPGFAVLLVFAVFAVSILLVLLYGGNNYRKMIIRDRDSFNKRTVCQYLTTRIRQADLSGAVTVEDFQGCDALVLREEMGDRVYLTRVYCYDGMLMELYTPESGNFSPADGEKLLEAQDLCLTIMGNTLTVQIEVSDGTSQTLILTLRSQQGGAL